MKKIIMGIVAMIGIVSASMIIVSMGMEFVIINMLPVYVRISIKTANGKVVEMVLVCMEEREQDMDTETDRADRYGKMENGVSTILRFSALYVIIQNE